MQELPLTVSELVLEEEVVAHAAGALLVEAKRVLLGEGPGRIVVLGDFGSGKTQLCQTLAFGDERFLSVPLRVVSRHRSISEGLRAVIGPSRLDEAQAGQRILLLDGFDEVADPGPGGFPAFFERLTSLAGPRWMVTSRPGHFRTETAFAPDQVDTLTQPSVATFVVDPLDPKVVLRVLSALPGGADLVESVEGLSELSRSPLLLHAVHVALPYIEPGRPIQPWGVFDCWIRHDLDTGPGHDEAIGRMVEMAWSIFSDRGHSVERTSFEPERCHAARLPPQLASALLVSDLDGQVRFGHRSVYEFLLASYLAPRIHENQGQGPDRLTGLPLSEATRAFLVGRIPPMPVEIRADRALVPRGNFIAGGDRSSDERPLRIEHLGAPFFIARAPVTQRDWAKFLTAHPDDRVDANYLPHWGSPRRMPKGQGDLPIYHLWPEDADAYAAWQGARLPTAGEWEKAVRGTDGRKWPWGDVWKSGLAVTAEAGLERPLPVRALGAQGPCELFSAAGGVFEYTSSQWGGRPDRGRVVMGGCYTHDHRTSRASLRLSHKLSGRLKAGLRLAWDAS